MLIQQSAHSDELTLIVWLLSSCTLDKTWRTALFSGLSITGITERSVSTCDMF